MKVWALCVAVFLSGCSANPPLPGLGPLTLQYFSIANIDAHVMCRGAFEHIGGALTAKAWMRCDDGRTGGLQLNTWADGPPFSGIVHLCDGSISSVAFSQISKDHAHGTAPSLHRRGHQRKACKANRRNHCPCPPYVGG